jgi:hypothetical protein
MRLKILAITILIFASSLVQAKIIKLECEVPNYAAKSIVIEIDTALDEMRFVYTGGKYSLTTTPHKYIGRSNNSSVEQAYIDRTDLSYRSGNNHGKCKVFKQRKTLI